MPRYVILEHDHPTVHWDFMLESGDVLRTWRLGEVPVADRVITAERTSDHRPAYLDYEGPVTGGRGVVARWDHGSFEWVADRADFISVRLSGKRLHGGVTLVKRSDIDWAFTLIQA